MRTWTHLPPATTAISRKLKGINVIGTLKALAREHGQEIHDAVLRGLAGEVGEALRTGGVVARGGYPAAWYDGLLKAIVARVGGGAETARKLSREAVKADFKTLFKVMSLLMAPQRALQQSMRVSRRYVDGGEIEVVEAKDGFMRHRLSEYYDYSHLMWWDFIGSVEGGDGDHQVEFTLRWTS